MPRLGRAKPHPPIIRGAVLPVIASITPSSPIQYQIFQRGSVGSGRGAANIPQAGTYVGSPSTGIEGNWQSGTYADVMASPSGGAYAGKLSQQTVGTGTVAVRFKNNTSINASIANVGVGDVYVIAGQSNASGRGTNPQAVTFGSGWGTLFGNDYAWKSLSDPTDSTSGQVDAISQDATTPGGSCWPAMVNSLVSNYSIPIALIPCAMGGSAITDWLPGANHENRSTLYGSMIYRARNTAAAGTRGIRGVLWWQGETEAATGTTQASYFANLKTLADAVFADLGCPLIPCKLQNASAYDTSTINLAIGQAWAECASVEAGPNLFIYNTAPEDTAHLVTDAKLTSAGQDWATALATLYYQTIGSGSGHIKSRIQTGY